MRLLILFLSLVLSACAITPMNDYYAQTVSSWRWAKAKQLLQNWGKPSKIAELPNGNQVYIYYKESYKQYQAPAITSQVAAVPVGTNKAFIVVPNPNMAQPGTSFLLECTTRFEIDPRDIIVDVRASGNDCTGDNGFMISRSNPNSVNSP